MDQIESSQLQLLAALRSRILSLLADTAQELPGLTTLPDTQQQQQQQQHSSSSSSSEAGVPAAATTQQHPSSSSSSSSSSAAGAAAAAAVSAADCAVWAAAMRQLQQLLAVFVGVHNSAMRGNTFWALGGTIDAYLTNRRWAIFVVFVVIFC
jgi:hypothetical protein